jgi:hypothetical protein
LIQRVKIILFVVMLCAFPIVDTFALGWFWIDNINPNLYWDSNTVDITVQKYIARILQFLYIIATIYWIYWWFLILTAGEDKEENVKKWKTIIIQALVGIVVIFLAWAITSFFLWWSWTAWILSDSSGSWVVN